jgi:hypothetical protein
MCCGYLALYYAFELHKFILAPAERHALDVSRKTQNKKQEGINQIMQEGIIPHINNNILWALV